MLFDEFVACWQAISYPHCYRAGIHTFAKLYNAGNQFPVIPIKTFVYSEKEMKTLTREKIEQDYYAYVLTQTFK